MTDVAARFRTFQSEAAHWIALLADVPARHVLRHDTIHPAFHGCIDWHSACHATWALLAYRGLSGDRRYDETVDGILMPAKIAAEAADLAARPQFEMPYGRAWFLRLALEDRLVTGSTRLTFAARKAHHYALNFSRGWALLARADAAGDAELLASALDHIETNLFRPSWWRGDYRSVAHWVPQFGLFALERAMRQSFAK